MRAQRIILRLAGPKESALSGVSSVLHWLTRGFKSMTAAGREPARGVPTLSTLLTTLYTAKELRPFLHGDPGTQAILPALPEGGPLIDLCHETVEALERHGLIDAAFFARLIADRPRRAAEIRAVARARGVRI